MGIADDMKNLGEDIITSYDMRVKAIGALVKDTQKMLKGFQTEHKKMATNLRKSLEREVKEIETYVKNKLKEFSDAHAEMSEELKKELARYVDDMVTATRKLMKDIQARQKERNAEVADLLDAFKTEREKMAANWQKMAATMAEKRSPKPGAKVKKPKEIEEI